MMTNNLVKLWSVWDLAIGDLFEYITLSVPSVQFSW